ncbi:DUF6115 domain-containing protein [Amphibacillus sediminis]|uniref:DUF6115 domain-containing protein n=1 Tax=Amphibacillus sediminis TaxID=360185 RepID=UPI00082EA489|nr:hypothetical protein [Amphibacillus sediminis]
MFYILLFLSFLLHAISLIIIRQLKEKLARPEQVLADLTKEKKEIEDLLAVYLLELREENEKMIKHINDNASITNHSHAKSNNAHTPPLTSETVDSEDKPTNEQRYPSYQPVQIAEQQDKFEQSFAAQVLSLYSNGESVEAIAKKLNRGKTEVELLVKFHSSTTSK